MPKYPSWPTSNQGNIVGTRLANELYHRFDGGLNVLSMTDQADAALAELLATTPEMFNVKSDGATGDRSTNDSQAVMNTLTRAAATTGFKMVYIPDGVLWDYDSDPGDGGGTIKSRHPDNVVIVDDSGYDWDHAEFSGLRKVVSVALSNDGSLFFPDHDMNVKDRHPANSLNVISSASDAEILSDPSVGRASYVVMRDWVTRWLWGLDPGSDGTQKDSWRLTRRDPSTGSLTAAITIESAEGRTAFNSGSLLPTGVDWIHTVRAERNGVYRWRVQPTYDHSWQFLDSDNVQRLRWDIEPDGRIKIYGASDAIVYATIEDKYILIGRKYDVRLRTSDYSIENAARGSESTRWFTNQGASGTVVITLPDALQGQEYRFVVVTAQLLRVDPQDTEQFRGKVAGKYKESNTLGESLRVYCVVDGTWEFVEEAGAWTDE